MSEVENETIIIKQDPETHPHHNKEVICKVGTNAITLGPFIFHPTEETYVRTEETKNGMAVFRKA